jgi:hypothetical protein
MEDHLDRPRGDNRSSQHSRRSYRAYGQDNQRQSNQTTSKDDESPARSLRYDRRNEDKDSYRSGKTPYRDDEDPFNAGGIGDNKSNGIPSQRRVMTKTMLSSLMGNMT